MLSIMRRAEDGDPTLAQPSLGCAVQVVEMTALAVRNQAMRYGFQRWPGNVGQRDQRIALPRAGQPQWRQRMSGREHGVDQDAVGADLHDDGGVA